MIMMIKTMVMMIMIMMMKTMVIMIMMMMMIIIIIIIIMMMIKGLITTITKCYHNLEKNAKRK